MSIVSIIALFTLTIVKKTHSFPEENVLYTIEPSNGLDSGLNVSLLFCRFTGGRCDLQAVGIDGTKWEFEIVDATKNLTHIRQRDNALERRYMCLNLDGSTAITRVNSTSNRCLWKLQTVGSDTSGLKKFDILNNGTITPNTNNLIRKYLHSRSDGSKVNCKTTAITQWFIRPPIFPSNTFNTIHFYIEFVFGGTFISGSASCDNEISCNVRRVLKKICSFEGYTDCAFNELSELTVMNGYSNNWRCDIRVNNVWQRPVSDYLSELSNGDRIDCYHS